jgi:serine/threonine protein kinase
MSIRIGQQLGSYEITALIGKGGMGAVYRATDTRLNRTVAIKVCDGQFSERFAQEASVERQQVAEKQSAQIFDLLEQNTKLTQMTQELTQRIKDLTDEIHRKVGCGERSH